MILTLEQEVGVLEAESNRVVKGWMDNECSIGKSASFSTLLLMILIVGSTGTDVNSALTSY